MVFLCGRPGCGRESSATLQIDAPASTVTLVDPRVSRDGIPLCPHHADATTPPLGWTMNDLRSQNRAPLAPVHPLGPRTGEIAAGPARPRTGNPLFQDSRALDRDQPGSARPRNRRNRPDDAEVAGPGPGPARREVRTDAQRRADALPPDRRVERPERRRETLMDARSDAPPRPPAPGPTAPRMGGLSFPVSQGMSSAPARPAAGSVGPYGEYDADAYDTDDHEAEVYGAYDDGYEADDEVVVEAPPIRPAAASPSATARSGTGGATARSGAGRRSRPDDEAGDHAPASRPAKRRDAAEDEADDDEKFPWHFSFKNDEPQELQAKTPLLARAFRSSVG